MGWLTDFYSKIIKFPFVIRVEMRRQARSITHILSWMKFYIYGEIPKLVLEEHRVIKALGKQKKVGKKAKKAVKQGFELGFNEQVEETISLEEIEKIEKRLLSHEQIHGAINFEEKFGENVWKTIAGAHGKDREAYLKYLEPIIKVAEGGTGYKALMEEVRLLGPAQTNLLSAIALRLEIRAASKSLSKLKAYKQRLDGALSKYDNAKAKGNREQEKKRIGDVLDEIANCISVELQNNTLIAKRDFLLTILTLKYINDDEKSMMLYYENHVMPRLPEELQIKNLEELKKKLAENAHVLAQGLRRILRAEEGDQKLAKEITQFSKLRRVAA